MITAFLSIIDRLIKLKEYREQRVQKVFDKVLEPIFNDLLLVHRDYIQMFEKARALLPERSYSPQKFNQSLREAADYLRLRRVEFEPARVQLRTMIGELVGPDPKERKVSFGRQADAFVDAIVRYFEGDTGQVYVPRTTEDPPEPTLDYKTGGSDETPAISMVGKMEELIYEPISGLDSSLQGYFPLDVIKFDEGKSAYVLFGGNDAVHEQVDTALKFRMSNLRKKWVPICETFAELKVQVIGRG